MGVSLLVQLDISIFIYMSKKIRWRLLSVGLLTLARGDLGLRLGLGEWP